jgi:hypothetical protein
MVPQAALQQVVRSVVAADHTRVVFTVLNSEYSDIGRLWARLLRKAGVSNFFIVCTDEKCESIFKSEGIATLLLTPQGDVSSEKLSVKTSTFPNDYAVFVVSLKFQVMAALLKAGWDAVFSDVDALWLKNPLNYIYSMDRDVVFQPASFPKDVKQAWGFTVCTGFLGLRSSGKTVQLLQAAQAAFAGSDQAAFNTVLMRDYAIGWNARPERWEHCHVFRGWAAPIYGTCLASGLTFAALPHSRFQRHNVNRASTRYAVVCHPNSPKSEPGKLQVFRALGLV